MRKGEFVTQLLACRRMMAVVIYEIVRRPDIVDDLVQDSMLLALKYQNKFREDSSVRTWIYMIAKNRALMWKRSEMISAGITKTCGLEAVTLDLKDPRFHATRKYMPDKIYEDNEVIERFINATECLSQKLKVAVRLRALGELTYIEIAKELRTNESTVKARVHKAREKLRMRYAIT